MPRFAPLLAAALLSLIASLAAAQNRDHPGLVFADGLGWVTPVEATAKGYVEYERRWMTKAAAAKCATWEKERANKKSADRANAASATPLTWKTESKHYRITTNVPRFIVENEIKPFLDALYGVYGDVFKKDFGLSGKGANKKFIRIHHGYESYAVNEADSDGPPPRTTPGFILGGSELVCFYEDTDPAGFYSTVFHEGAHQFVHAMLPGANLPLWLDEALATYFEGCVYSRATKKITVGHFPHDRIAHAQELLRAAPEGDGAETLFMNVPDAGFEAEHYALAWSFVYYVTHTENGKHKDKFAKFLRATNGTGAKPISEVFEETTKLDLAELQRGWREFVLSLTVPPLPKRVFLEVSGNDDPPIDVKTGDVVWSVGDVEIFDSKAFTDAWENRSKDLPTKLVLVRRTDAPQPIDYTESFVTTHVRPESRVKIGVEATVPRDFNLRD